MARILVSFLLVGGLAYSAVVKTTTKDPAAFESSVTTAPIGAALGLRGPAGPGVFASTTAAALATVEGSLEKTTDASVTLSYDSDTGGTHFRLITTVIVGVSFSAVYSPTIPGIPGGSITASNDLEYAVTKDDDGDVQVVLSGSASTSAQSGVNGSQFKPIFKFYGSLVVFSNHASLTTDVSSTSTIAASPVSTGVANGQAAAWVLGLP